MHVSKLFAARDQCVRTLTALPSVRVSGALQTRASWSPLIDIDCQGLVHGFELTPTSVSVAALAPGQVGGEVLDVDLVPGAISGEILQWHPPLLDDEDGLVTVGGQRDLGDLLTSEDVSVSSSRRCGSQACTRTFPSQPLA